MVFTAICDCWWHLKSVHLKCYRRMASVKINLGRPRSFESRSGLSRGYLNAAAHWRIV